MNAIRKITFAEFNGLGIEEASEGLPKGVYEMFAADADDQHEDDWIDLIDTGGLSVNCRCLVVADTEGEANKLIEECDPSASGCNDTHLWLPTAMPVVKAIWDAQQSVYRIGAPGASLVSADGDEWYIGIIGGEHAEGGLFDVSEIVLVGGPRDGVSVG